MRRLLAAVLAAACVGGAAFAGSGTQYSGITTMTFQNGVAPTSDYAGTEDTYLSSHPSEPDNNFGASDSLHVTQATAPVRGQRTTLIKFDLSALPDSAIITKARLWLYTNFPSTAAAGTEPLDVYRLFNSWTEGSGGNTGAAGDPSWNERVSGTVWVGSGASSTNATLAAWRTGTASTLDSSYSGVSGFYGSDTLSTLSTQDYAKYAITTAYTKTGNTAAKRLGWVTFDITQQVRLWHIGANTNNGVKIDMSNGITYTALYSFWSSECATKVYRPKLVVEYFDPTTASSGSGRRAIGHTVRGVY